MRVWEEVGVGIEYLRNVKGLLVYGVGPLENIGLRSAKEHTRSRNSAVTGVQ